MGGGTLQHLQRFLKCIKYNIHEFASSTFSFIPLSQFLFLIRMLLMENKMFTEE
jgi:hypothetical protein